jgi:hypothetical protein
VNLSFRNPPLDAAGFTQFVQLGTGRGTIGDETFPFLSFSGSLKFNGRRTIDPRESGVDDPDHHDTVRAGHEKRPEEEAVDHADDRHDAADRERDGRRGGKARTPERARGGRTA